MVLDNLLFHGTSLARLSSIMSDGLVIGGEHVHVESGGCWDMIEPRTFNKGIFVSEDLYVAFLYSVDACKSVCPSLLGSSVPHLEHLVVVVLDRIPSGARVGYDGYGDLMVDIVIPFGCVCGVLVLEDFKRFGFIECLGG
ncbi:MAG: hypothetical protein ACTSPB_00365 [Candidatus Thorarchaeota archaeon]